MNVFDAANFISQLNAGLSVHHLEILRDVNTGKSSLEDAFNRLGNLLFRLENELGGFVGQVNEFMAKQMKAAEEQIAAARAAAAEAPADACPMEAMCEIANTSVEPQEAIQ